MGAGPPTLVRSSDRGSRLIAPRMSSSSPPDSNRRAWVVAWLLALALHALLVAGIFWLRVPAAAAVRPPEPEVVHVTLAPDATQPEAPRAYSELPKDRADTPPKQADLLSNVTSRARDREPDGQTDLPRMHGESDARLVKLEPEDSPSRPPPPASAERPAKPAESREPALQKSDSRTADERSDARFDSTSTERRLLAPPRMLSDVAIRVNPGSFGNAGIRQPEMNSDGNAGLTGDVSLNTTAWEYAPWMERFSRKLMDHWVAPLVYSMGVLKDGGWCVLEVEISKSGELLRCDVLEQQEHHALTLAAESAVRSSAPMERLPDHFPEQTLILRLRMIYPRIRPR